MGKIPECHFHPLQVIQWQFRNVWKLLYSYIVKQKNNRAGMYVHWHFPWAHSFLLGWSSWGGPWALPYEVLGGLALLLHLSWIQGLTLAHHGYCSDLSYGRLWISTVSFVFPSAAPGFWQVVGWTKHFTSVQFTLHMLGDSSSPLNLFSYQLFDHSLKPSKNSPMEWLGSLVNFLPENSYWSQILSSFLPSRLIVPFVCSFVSIRYML